MILGYILHLIKIMPISDGMFQSVVDPLTIGLVIGGVKALAGGIQALAAGKKRPEPKYEIPKEVFEVTRRAEEMAQTGMPEASRMQALQGAQQSALFGMRAAQDRRGGLAALGNIQAGLDRANLSVAAQDASMRQQNMVRAQQALMTQAQYKDKAFGNQWQSWMNKEQQRRANIGAGLQNIMGGIDFVGSMAAMGLLGGAGKTTTTTTDNMLSVSPASVRNSIAGTPSFSQLPPAGTPSFSQLPPAGTVNNTSSFTGTTGAAFYPFLGSSLNNLLSGQMFNTFIRR
jgi:hypothetical protein